MQKILFSVWKPKRYWEVPNLFSDGYESIFFRAGPVGPQNKKLGEAKIHEFRRSWDVAPDPLNQNSPYHPINIETYKNVPRNKIPDTESLKDTFERVTNYYEKNISDKIDKNIVIAAHGNSIRALCKYLFKINENDISKLEIPTGNPLLIEFEKGIVKNARYLDKERAQDLINF